VRSHSTVAFQWGISVEINLFQFGALEFSRYFVSLFVVLAYYVSVWVESGVALLGDAAYHGHCVRSYFDNSCVAGFDWIV
jgi:hypothetical protein